MIGLMRQVCAVLLLGVFGTSTVAWAVFADRATGLAACCRRDGKHRCEMQATGRQDSSSGLGVQAASMKCPLFPKVGPLSSCSQEAGLSAAQAIFASLVRHPAVRPQIEALYRVSFSRASQKRGPPVVLS